MVAQPTNSLTIVKIQDKEIGFPSHPAPWAPLRRRGFSDE